MTEQEFNERRNNLWLALQFCDDDEIDDIANITEALSRLEHCWQTGEEW